MNTTTAPDEYRLPQSAGAVEFTPDPATNEEQIDFRQSTLERLTRETIDQAQPRHEANPDDYDRRRVEFGGAIVGTIETTTQQPVPEYNPTDVALMARYTQQITHWRDMEQSSYDRAA
jgi:hypothetical protein